MEKELYNEKLENEILDKVLKNFGQEVFTPGLERSRPLYEFFRTKIIIEKIKIITVAGTNGKGQTCHTISSILTQSNISTALWTSPHILSIRERFLLNDVMITYSELNKVIELCLQELKKYDFKVSFYEFLFLVFLKWIENKKLDLIIFEVGLGGRYDAVNHFDADLALITSISRDHQAILGNRYDHIIMEKLGITRKERQLITSFKLKYLEEITSHFCHQNNIKYHNLKLNINYFESNIQLAKKAIETLYPNLLNKIEIPTYKGRFEFINWGESQIIFLGAHNPDGMREAFVLLNERKLYADIILLSFSKRDQVDIEAMLKTTLSQKKQNQIVKLTFFDHPKAIKRENLEDVFQSVCHNKSIEIISDWKMFLNGIRNSTHQKKILVMGSYYFIGEVQRYLLSDS